VLTVLQKLKRARNVKAAPSSTSLKENTPCDPNQPPED
jgi:hypothetical protein